MKLILKQLLCIVITYIVLPPLAFITRHLARLTVFLSNYIITTTRDMLKSADKKNDEIDDDLLIKAAVIISISNTLPKDEDSSTFINELAQTLYSNAQSILCEVKEKLGNECSKTQILDEMVTRLSKISDGFIKLALMDMNPELGS